MLSKHFKSALAGLFMLFSVAAMPAHAQSLEDQAAAADPSTTVVSYVQAPVPTETTITPHVSFQSMGSSDDWHLYVDVNLHSYHFNRAEARQNNYLEENYGAGFEYTNDVLGVMAGYYHNSIHYGSWYIGGRYTPVQFDFTSKDRVNVGLFFGAVSGYRKTTYTQGYKVTQVQDPVWGLQPLLTPAMVPNGTKPRGFIPAAGLLVSYEHNHEWGVNLIFVPPVPSEGVAAFGAVQARIAIPASLGF